MIIFSGISGFGSIAASEPEIPVRDRAQKLNWLQERAVVQGQKSKYFERMILVERLSSIIESVEKTQEMIKTASKYDDPKQEQSIRLFIDSQKAELKRLEAELTTFQKKIEEDPSLLKHAKMIIAEEARLDAEAKKKGENYFKSEECNRDIVEKMFQYSLNLAEQASAKPK
jgi:cell division protein FtsB